MRIGEAARSTGLTVKAIRHYDAVGLLGTLDRDGTYRDFSKEDIERLKSMQLDIHKIFIDMVKERRGAKLADDPELFTGAFWAGHKAKELGLVDHIGDMRSFLKERYGEKTELRLVQPQRNLFGRRQATGIISALNGVDAEALTAAAGTGLANAMEDRSIWARYGL